MITDITASSWGVSWEQYLHQLKEDGSYKIFKATVRSFNGAKYLLLSDKAVITTVGDMGNVIDESTYDGRGDINVVETYMG